ncbi:uncharacterized protein LOC123259565 [Cotesia glomerata]|uniref:Uncharacterized protein n=1 Tax=Cotesia glomerata TaxID=32391 RepID=A0AAV7I5C0_COTGL|nr:uncharacterized protein LOC123259565 [Cotesia glomerata]KAH0541113.1 hypothetical protein KQX54_021076 [Cotesia glomerata]
MEQLCPLCQKTGVVSRLSNYPLNESEDIEMCENEKCVWPFGHEAFKFIPKIDEDLKEIVETSKNLPVIPISTELSLYTPPVTPVDNQEAKTDVKGITDSYASPATIIKDIQVSGSPSPSIFDIDSPEKNLTSRSTQSCDKKLVFKSNFPGAGAKKKSLPIVTNTETVTSMRILKRVPMKKMVLKKVIKPVINNVNKNISTVPFNHENSLELPKSISVSENKLDPGEVEVKAEDKDQNFTLDLQDISFDESFIKQDNNFESIIPELDSGDLNQQMDVDDWLNSLIL